MRSDWGWSWPLIKAGTIAVVLVATVVSAQTESLFSDPKANEIGDALTVIIQENATATNQTATNTAKNNNTSISSTIPGDGNVLDFIPLHGLDSQINNGFSILHIAFF